MLDNLAGFFIQWAITSICLWGASLLFNGIRFSSTSSLVISALLLGFANAVLRPLLVILTLPLTLVRLWTLQRACDVQVTQAALGAAIRYHADFAPKGTNANFISLAGPDTVRIDLWDDYLEPA